MKLPTHKQRLAALVASINRSEIEQGRPRGLLPRDSKNLGASILGGYGCIYITVSIDGEGGPRDTFLVFRDWEADTIKHTFEKDLTEDHIFVYRGKTWYIVLV